MSIFRKLEVGCGLATALLGFAAAAEMFIEAMNVTRELHGEFNAFEATLVVSVIYLLPGLLIARASYVHASRARTWGIPVIIVCSLFLATTFLLLLFGGVYHEPNLVFWIDFAVPSLAIATMAISIIVRFQEH